MFDFKRKSADQEQISSGEDVILWGDLPLLDSEAVKHFLAIGAPGSGKSTILRLLLQDVLPNIRPGKDARALIYDAKQDTLPLLYGICPKAKISPLNPFDERGVAWDIGADVREPRLAIEIAFTLMPPEQESQPFFSNAARHLTAAAMMSFILSGHEWKFADLVRTLKSPKALRAVLKKHDTTRELVSLYFSDRRLGANIMSTVATKFLTFEPIAAAWEAATESVSLQNWAKRSEILVLPNSEISRAAIDAINRCIFKRASDITLDQPDSRSRRVWFVVDELAEAGRLELISLMKKGRSKGACLGVALQSISGLRDPKMYGTHFTDDLLGQVGNRFFGRLECAVTAEWASKLFGDQEIEAISRTTNNSGGQTTTSETRKDEVRRAVLASELMSIPPCDEANGVSGYFLTRVADPFLATLDGEEVFRRRLRPLADVPGFAPRPVETQFLRPWTPEERKRLGIPTDDPKARRKRKRSGAREISPAELDDLFGNSPY